MTFKSSKSCLLIWSFYEHQKATYYVQGADLEIEVCLITLLSPQPHPSPLSGGVKTQAVVAVMGDFSCSCYIKLSIGHFLTRAAATITSPLFFFSSSSQECIVNNGNLTRNGLFPLL